MMKKKVKRREPKVITSTPQQPFGITSIDTIGQTPKTVKCNVDAVTIRMSHQVHTDTKQFWKT